MSKSKDSSSKLHEKHQTILAQLLRDEDNKYCADCMVKGARWASWNLGVFMCIRCAGIHRNLGVHISRVKSVNLDSWTPEQIESIQKKGNGYAKSKYEANLPANFRRPQDDYAVEQFIRAKYERKLYLSKDTDAQPKPAVTKEAPDSKAKNKPKKTSNSLSTQKSSRSDQVVSVPRPATVRHSPSPQPVKPTPSASKTTASKTTGSSLISLESEAPPSTKKGAAQPVVDILTGLTPSSTTLSSNASNSSSSPNFLMSSQPVGNQPLIGIPTQPSPPTGSVPPSNGVSAKDSIMSLYGAAQQPQLSSYSAQGYPINAMYYQQQQSAAMQMAHMAAVQQHQVNQVTTQMQQIRMTQQPPQHTPPQFPNSMNNGGVPVMGMGGQTLNPTLW